MPNSFKVDQATAALDQASAIIAKYFPTAIIHVADPEGNCGIRTVGQVPHLDRLNDLGFKQLTIEIFKAQTIAAAQAEQAQRAPIMLKMPPPRGG